MDKFAAYYNSPEKIIELAQTLKFSLDLYQGNDNPYGRNGT